MAVPRFIYLLSGAVGGAMGLYHSNFLAEAAVRRFRNLVRKRRETWENKQYKEYLRTYDLPHEKLKAYEDYIYDNVPASNDVKDVKSA